MEQKPAPASFLAPHLEQNTASVASGASASSSSSMTSTSSYDDEDDEQLRDAQAKNHDEVSFRCDVSSGPQAQYSIS